MKPIRRLVTVCLLISLTACAPWTRIDPNTRLETRSDDYSIELPVGWVKQTAGANDIFITRDGPALNYIAVARQPHSRKLPYTKRETRADMLPHELAELVVAEWKSAEATANMEIVSNAPLLLDGRPAVRVQGRYKNERGLPIERIVVTLVDARGRLTLFYEAPAIVYFQRGLPDFDTMLASLRFRMATPKP
ncbi:MAG: hypothetical protein ACLGG6_03430 [Gammaproteobacteria bacterium]